MTATVMKDAIKPKGRVELFVTQGVPKLHFFDPIPYKGHGVPLYRGHDIDFSGCRILENQDVQNIIVNQGKDKVIQALSTGIMDAILRMAVGDRGTIPSDSTVPKVPTADMTALYNEVYRDDIEGAVLNIGTEDTHEVRFVKTFSAAVIPVTSFSNQAQPILNEVALITAGTDILPPRPPVAAPDTPSADEKVFSIRTFKSVPFEAANDIALTIRYTIYIE